MRQFKINKENLPKKIFILLFILCLIGFIWALKSYLDAKNQLDLISKQQNQQQLSKKEIAELVAKVSKHMILTETEEPLIATIIDAKALAKEQSFYKNAENGDRVIVFPERAIIFSEKKDKIVNVGPVVTTRDQTSNQDQASRVNNPNSLKLEIRNGSQTVGAATNLSRELSANSNYEVVKTVNTRNKGYRGISVINLKNKNIDSLVSQLNAKVLTNLPDTEEASGADVLIIVGDK